MNKVRVRMYLVSLDVTISASHTITNNNSFGSGHHGG